MGRGPRQIYSNYKVQALFCSPFSSVSPRRLRQLTLHNHRSSRACEVAVCRSLARAFTSRLAVDLTRSLFNKSHREIARYSHFPCLCRAPPVRSLAAMAARRDQGRVGGVRRASRAAATGAEESGELEVQTYHRTALIVWPCSSIHLVSRLLLIPSSSDSKQAR